MQFRPFVLDKTNAQISVFIEPMTQLDAGTTNMPPVWQTSWTSEYLVEDRFEKYAAKVGNELIALGAYEILEHSLVVHMPIWNPILSPTRPLTETLQNIRVSGD